MRVRAIRYLLSCVSLIQAFVAAVVLVIVCPSAAAEHASSFRDVIAPTFKQHCVKCHGQGQDVEGDVNLQNITAAQFSADSELIQNLIDVIDLQEMPPEGESTLEDHDRTELLGHLRRMLDLSIANNKRYAPTAIRRMNRFQYNNAVIDLFDLNCIVFTLPERMLREHRGYFQPASGKMPGVVSVGSRPLGKSQMIEPRLLGVAAFPQDLRAEHGFDNRADHLSLSPLLMESFLKLGRSITHSPDFTRKRVGIWNDFFASPSPDSNPNQIARDRLKPFLRRAFRRGVNDVVVERYARYADQLLDEGIEFPEMMKLVASVVIASPRFLYLYDTADDSSTEQSEIRRVGDYELASRLSFFLWGSIPDAELLNLAEKNQLGDPAVLSAQFNRMIQDRKLKRFCDSFPSQWLQLERIISSVPDPEHFPEFYFSKYRDSMHMMLEPLLLFETVLIENHPITQLIDSDFTYRSGLLENAYGELASNSETAPKNGGGVGALQFHRVPINDRRTGGVITNAAVMTMTSGPERTQPITRGAWIATVIFNHPPEPPPADVPPLAEKPPEGEEHLTLRERLSLHRERSDCKGCHEQIDPLGFALENYNPIGVWRETYENGRDVDSAGTLFRKHDFQDVAQFKDAILAEKDRFTRGFAAHLLSFALARELDAADQLAVEKIASVAADDDYRMQTLLKQIVLSEPFLSKSTSQESP